MKITVTKQVTTKEEIEVDIPVPSFWKKIIPDCYDEFIHFISDEQHIFLTIYRGHFHDAVDDRVSIRTNQDSDVIERIAMGSTWNQITPEEFNSAKREAIARLRFEGEEKESEMLHVLNWINLKYGDIEGDRELSPVENHMLELVRGALNGKQPEESLSVVTSPEVKYETSPKGELMTEKWMLEHTPMPHSND